MKKLLLILLILLCFGDAHARNVVSSRTTVASRTTISSRPDLHEIWNTAFATVNSTSGQSQSHDMIECNVAGGGNKLWIAGGQGVNSAGRTWIFSYDGTTVTKEALVPVDDYSVIAPSWRNLACFGGNLYATLGEATYPPTGNNYQGADIYKWDGATLTKVKDTSADNNVFCYPMLVWNSKLWAGCGGYYSGNTGKLYSSVDGTSWTLEHTFTEKLVRGLVIFNGDMYIGTRDTANLYKYDNGNYTLIGKPTPPWGLTLAQMKSLVAYNNKLYIGCVQGFIYSYTPSGGFVLEYDMTEGGTLTSSEIYHGTVTSNGLLFFPMRTGAGIGKVAMYDGNSWRTVYTSINSEFHSLYSIKEYNGNIYLGGIVTNTAGGKNSLILKTPVDRTTVP